jgi:hypothetical protein
MSDLRVLHRPVQLAALLKLIIDLIEMAFSGVTHLMFSNMFT